MTGLSWVRWLGVMIAIASCDAQIFPFSNLKHFFDQKGKGGGDSHASDSAVRRLKVPAPVREPVREPLLPTALPTTTEPPTTTARYSLYEEDDSHRELHRPESSGSSGRPTKTKPAKQKKRPADNHSYPPQQGRRPHRVPLKIAYEPVSGAAGDVHVSPSATGGGQPPLYLTPPRLPANPVAAEPLASSASSPSIDTAAMPPVPAAYLRPPAAHPHPAPYDPQQSEELQLADVALAAVSHSKNPAILKGMREPNSTPANHKLTTSQHNALGGAGGTSKLENEYTNHKAAGRPLDKYTKLEKHGPSNHRARRPGEDTPNTHLVESSASETTAVAALGAYRTPPNHRPAAASGPRHKNHKPPPPSPSPPPPPRRPKQHPANHKPASHLDGQESMTNLRYRKRPLGPIEQEVSASGLQHAGFHPGAGTSDGDRVEFQMHGLQGPESYKFGYDTGKGHNRQFRYEERDPHGNVKGHYGYVDQHGKLQVVNYKADKHHGYSADVSKLQP